MSLKYFAQNVEIGNQASEVGLVTLWTKKELILKHITKEHFAFIGQLYSKSTGISAIVRNCLYNKKIRHIVVIGADLSGSGQALIGLFERGIGEDHQITTDRGGAIDAEIPLASIENVRKNVRVHDLRSMTDYSTLGAFLAKLNGTKQGPYGEPEIFPEHVPLPVSTYPSYGSGFLVEDDFISTAWLKVLRHVMRFGTEKPTSYHDRQKELLNLMVVIHKEDPDNPKIEPYVGFTKEDLFRYYPLVVSAASVSTIEYTYGMRLMNHKGIDQIEHIIRMLSHEPHSRRAVGVTWSVAEDSTSVMSPCLILVQAIVQNKKLFLTAYFRSNDMFEAWPKNSFALRKLQTMIADRLKTGVGSLTTISSSAHIYERHFEKAAEIIAKHKPEWKMFDERGKFIIYVKEKEIYVQHQNNNDEVIAEYRGKNASSLINQLVDAVVLADVSHALYLGAELEKAEIALRTGTVYHQDLPLELP